MPLTLTEIFTIVLAVLGCWFAVTRAANVPRELWRAQAAAIGSGLLALGVAGTTWMFQSNLSAAAGMSRTTRHLALEAALEYAHRPLIFGVFGAALFWLLLSSSGAPDGRNLRAPGDWLARMMMLGAFASLGLCFVYVGRLYAAGEDDAMFLQLLEGAMTVSLATLILAVVGGLWGSLRGGAPVAAA